MDSMTQRDRDLLEESFSLYDTVGDSKIDIGILGEALRGLGLNPTEGDVQKIVKELDSTGSRRVSFEEFLPMYLSLSSKGSDRHKKNVTDFIECFRVFDKEQNGTVSAGELQHVMTTLGEPLTPAQVDLLTSGIEDKNGMVNIEEFVAIVMQG